MTIRVALNHKTEYHYDRLVSLSPQTVRLRPAPHCRTPVVGYSLKVTPSGHFINWQQDPQGNYLARLVFPKKTDRFIVEVDLVVEMITINPFDFFLDDSAQKYPFAYEPQLEHELGAYLELGEAGPLLKGFVAALRERSKEPMVTVDWLVDLNMRVHQMLKYDIRLEPGVQTSEETLTKKGGSCRDMAWLLVEILRHMGLAARFVSGYLIQLAPDVKSLDGPSGPETDFTDLHAWTEVYLPGAGWVGLDPTSGLFAGEGHLPLAATPDPVSAAPITGGISWAKKDEDDKLKDDFVHTMKVTRIHEDPRVTKPYTRDQWARVMDLGQRVDDELRERDVRLTMGGEPTFVSVDDMEGAEWNIEAMGPNKRRLSYDLLMRLRDHFAPKGLLHFGQGKWYPGESLPRWAFTCYWREDGTPLWNDPALIGDERTTYGYTERESERFIRAFASRLGLEQDHVIPAHEDAWYYMWKERRLPTNVDPFDARLDSKEDRERLARIFEQGLNKTIGHVIPLQRGVDGWGDRWVSGAWFFRPERMYLIPGDSPIGFRLPLDSLPWVSKTDYPYIIPPDTLERRSALPKPEELRRAQQARQAAFVTASARSAGAVGNTNRAWGDGGANQQEQRLPEKHEVEHGKSASWIIRTAMCIEARKGRLYAFMPPVRTAEHYLELVTALEDTAAEVNMPIQLEGYTPPSDPRINHFKITPDPGVIEVNIQPAHSWDELVHNTCTLYDEARLARLGTEKFLVDGRHSGTGGGNHVVMGGPTPADSPFLRRPDLLRSLVGYWHNHPSLSYIFSGLFVGPTSQAPRVDEARNDSLYELEIAWDQLGQGSYTPPWLVDRTLRNLLVDLTGNTHRAEFCIDKLFSPDSASGRQGLVEFRAFEMPPHKEMSLAQQLLLRTLVARFWEKPYETQLVRWGTELHDRFMLPHFVWQDFTDVLEDLRNDGYPFEDAWYTPHLEFRFPVYGDVSRRDINVELRQAIEPWHVLGEQGMSGGASRSVDSSVERLQVKVRGLVESRYAVTCNGYTVPLHPTGTVGEHVAGVRFRAWQPPECLHPTIGIHSPLIFDVVDTWNRRTLGGCTYHVVHPGGLSYNTFPVNGLEAEARRVARFYHHGHTPGSVNPAPVSRTREFPMTLDLRHPVA